MTNLLHVTIDHNFVKSTYIVQNNTKLGNFLAF